MSLLRHEASHKAEVHLFGGRRQWAGLFHLDVPRREIDPIGDVGDLAGLDAEALRDLRGDRRRVRRDGIGLLEGQPLHEHLAPALPEERVPL